LLEVENHKGTGVKTEIAKIMEKDFKLEAILPSF